MQRGLLLDVVIGQGAPVIQLLPGEDEPLLVRRDACMQIKIQASKAVNNVYFGQIGRVVNRSNKQEKGWKRDQGDNGWITFLVLDLGLDVVNGVAALDLQRDGLPVIIFMKICIFTDGRALASLDRFALRPTWRFATMGDEFTLGIQSDRTDRFGSSVIWSVRSLET